MRTLIIVTHPSYTSSTTQHFFKESTAGLEQVTWHVLDQQIKADGHFDVTAEQQLVATHDRIIFQFPLYWYSAPFLLKQWIDEVIDWNLKKKSSKELGLVVTLGVKASHFQSGGREGFTLSELYRPFHALAQTLHWTFLPPLNVFKFAQLTEDEKKLLLIRYRRYVTHNREDSLIQRETWAVNELEQLIAQTTDASRKMQLQLVVDVLLNNQQQRLDLEHELEPFRWERD
ncbi:NAD(P)H-dependent oxidoreductase [Atopobacter phocae]|uniref:NAD(P)H-dependent oxidoreductase n=1 Tax=Atopobacter phocae TaxID=136492 RepID=UPI00046F7054|nr:NAD(P)H-dependent oxidoreductase [Atopobacter phocae]